VVPTLASVAASLVDRAGVPEYLSEAAERGGFWFSSLDFRGEIVEKAVLDWKVRIGHREPRDLDDKTIDDLLLDVLLLTGPCLQSTVTDRADRASFLKSQREVFEVSFRAENGETFDWRQYFARELAHSRMKRGR
jgi:hypothetical protein